MGFDADSFILLFSALLIIGVLTTKFSNRIGLPSLVLYIAVGMILNKFIYYDSASLTKLFGILALIIIIFEGGLNAKWISIRKVIVPAGVLATIGVMITAGIVGIFAKLILGLSWLEGMLFGAIVGSTDAAAVFAVLGNKNIRPKLTSTLEAESGTNDPMAIFLTTSLIAFIESPDNSLGMLLLSFFWEMGFGLVMGLIIGKLAIWSINKINLDSSGLYPVFAIAFAISTYSVTTLLHGSGLLAVYVMALCLGNSDVTYRFSIVRFNEGFAWMMQILMFVLLGLLVFPDQLVHIVWQGLALSFILMIIARPIGVAISMIGFNFTGKEVLFLSWAGLRGAVPIVLATYPMLAGLENSGLIFNVVFFVVLTSTLIQGSTISPLANKLKLVGEKKPKIPHNLELVSLGKTNAEIYGFEIDKHSGIAYKKIQEIDFPEDTLIQTIIRGSSFVTPKGSTTIEPGDLLYILATKAHREKVKQLVLGDEEGESHGQAEKKTARWWRKSG
ncbi:potassium/proton antiporter [Paenibacillus larvae]|uniref:Cell volume regulation protein A n=3 Tax=Paenibacillus larvae TaxID=1464 RepID=A0A2L1TP18_9BACL|nr:potassium/proton antiporter [Paenibacillus larvae]AQR76703.1 K+/H+ antiporter [Paenibacillus larvae subsp. larvae]AQT83577.1 K+/H+ antiporter [Paenibacillus larvae subsp. pulvifaciens]AQZ48680.1 K+/H+ antiporter [Paenibacillus larvae subsp. pulvifaciens]AVF22426.1 cell volume regulation protein A [Paenibacillus larvae subsp. larvae]AVF26762.1 cell volume regulation protein A [Paenibacillus larvae subsp. larvae]